MDAIQPPRDKHEARRCFEDELNRDPYNSFTLHKLGLLLEEEFNELDNARICFERAIQANPHNAAAYNSLGLRLKKDQPQKALESFARAMELDPSNARPIKNRGICHLHLKEYDQAIEWLRHGLKVDPNNATIYLSLGDAYLSTCGSNVQHHNQKRAEYKKAEECYRAAFVADSTNPLCYCRLGVLKEDQKDYAAAKKIYEDGIKAAPLEMDCYLKLGKLAEHHLQPDALELARDCYAACLRLMTRPVGSEQHQWYKIRGALQRVGKLLGRKSAAAAAAEGGEAATSESSTPSPLRGQHQHPSRQQSCASMNSNTSRNEEDDASSNASASSSTLLGNDDRWAALPPPPARKGTGNNNSSGSGYYYNSGSTAGSIDSSFIEELMLSAAPSFEMWSLSDASHTHATATSTTIAMGSGEGSTELVCPMGHGMVRVHTKPRTYRPKATWACEECKKSIGGVELQFNGALYCPTCKYDLCSHCEAKPRKAHVIPHKPIFLGRGSFGSVYREYDPVSEQYAAVKHISLALMSSEKIVREVELLDRFKDSRHIVRVLRCECTPEEFRVYMELMRESLGALVRRQGALHELAARGMIKDALLGLAAMHGETKDPVIHRDVKPDNLLLNERGETKLSDFGLSKDMPVMATAAQSMGLKGTFEFLAPECFADPPRWGPATDIWALGCTWLALTEGSQHPWVSALEGPQVSNPFAMAYHFSQHPNTKPPVPTYLSSQARELLGRCFLPRHERISAVELLKHPYFANTDENSIPSDVETTQQHTERCHQFQERTEVLTLNSTLDTTMNTMMGTEATTSNFLATIGANVDKTSFNLGGGATGKGSVKFSSDGSATTMMYASSSGANTATTQ